MRNCGCPLFLTEIERMRNCGCPLFLTDGWNNGVIRSLWGRLTIGVGRGVGRSNIEQCKSNDKCRTNCTKQLQPRHNVLFPVHSWIKWRPPYARSMADCKRRGLRRVREWVRKLNVVRPAINVHVYVGFREKDSNVTNAGKIIIIDDYLSFIW